MLIFFFCFYCWGALARQHTIIYNSGENPKFVGCKVGSMGSWLIFYYPGYSRLRGRQMKMHVERDLTEVE